MSLKRITRIPRTKLPDNRFETISGLGGVTRGPNHEHPKIEFSQEEKVMYRAFAPIMGGAGERETSG
jgi:hypothetical protein